MRFAWSVGTLTCRPQPNMVWLSCSSRLLPSANVGPGQLDFPNFQAGYLDFYVEAQLKIGIQFNSWYVEPEHTNGLALALEGPGFSF